MGTLFVDKLDPQSGTSLELGSSGDTITIPSGCTITNNGTQTGFGQANKPAFHAYKSGSSQSVLKLVFKQNYLIQMVVMTKIQIIDLLQQLLVIIIFIIN